MRQSVSESFVATSLRNGPTGYDFSNILLLGTLLKDVAIHLIL